MDRKSQLANVAFGGDWAEQIIPRETAQSAIEALERAVRGCRYEDYRNDAVRDALEVVRVKPKGDLLASRFWKALSNRNPALREQEAGDALRLIRSAIGVSIKY